MYRPTTVLIIVAILWAVGPVLGQENQAGESSASSTKPQGQLRYVNPLVMENAGRLADPTVIKFQETYYLYLTGGVSPGGRLGAAVWSSTDLVNWKHHDVSIAGGRGIGAPTAFEYEGYVYLAGNDTGLFAVATRWAPLSSSAILSMNTGTDSKGAFTTFAAAVPTGAFSTLPFSSMTTVECTYTTRVAAATAYTAWSLIAPT